MEKRQPTTIAVVKTNFWAYFISMTITFVGFYGFTYLITWLMINETKTPQLLGNVLAATMVPAIGLNLVAQRLLTKVNARAMMIITDLLTGGLLVAVYFLMSIPGWQIGVLIMASILNKTIGVFYKLSNKMILPTIFPATKIQQVNGIQTQVRQVAIVSATMVISLVLLIASPRSIILLIGIGFLTSAFFDNQLTFLTADSVQVATESKMSLRSLLQQPDLVRLVGFAMIGSLIDASLAVLIPWLTVTYFHRSVILSLLMTSEALGIISGPLWLRWVPAIKSKTLSGLATGTLLLFGPNLGILLVGMLLIGSFRGALNVRLFSKIQTETAPKHLGSLLALVLTLTDTATVVGTLLIPKLTPFWHQWTLSGVGLGLLILTIGIATWRPRVD